MTLRGIEGQISIKLTEGRSPSAPTSDQIDVAMQQLLDGAQFKVVAQTLGMHPSHFHYYLDLGRKSMQSDFV